MGVVSQLHLINLLINLLIAFIFTVTVFPPHAGTPSFLQATAAVVCPEIADESCCYVCFGLEQYSHFVFFCISCMVIAVFWYLLFSSAVCFYLGKLNTECLNVKWRILPVSDINPLLWEGVGGGDSPAWGPEFEAFWKGFKADEGKKEANFFG